LHEEKKIITEDDLGKVALARDGSCPARAVRGHLSLLILRPFSLIDPHDQVEHPITLSNSFSSTIPPGATGWLTRPRTNWAAT